MADASEVQEALESVLNDDAESQSVKGSSTEVAEALEQALKPSGSDKVDDASEGETKEGAEGTGKEAKTVPYERFSQVVKQRSEISEKFKNLEDQFKTATAREAELRGRVGDLEQDSQILNAIKQLARDEKYREHVVAIDKALQGIEDDREVAEHKGDQKAVSDAEKRFEEKTAELEELIADQRAEDLWNQTAEMARSMLAALPEDYTEEDKAILGKYWTPRVDWNSIEQQGVEAIPVALNVSFAEVLKEYGTPKGALVARTTKEVESRVPESKLLSGEDVVKGILEKDKSARDDKGNFTYSDQEFESDMAEILRRTRGGA